ncbi:hypothetical protein ACIQ9Q_17140 [Streptomyces sp. NPDC094438]|uniref:hypothetical protein n=1 Tax=Streptomyces sp. NPDC094438 TaxID=3366061 RepID=UPI00382B4571
MITLVAGPPCAGKSSYVESQREAGDLVVDFDAVMSALSGADSHDHPEALIRYAHAARSAVVSELLRSRNVNAWVIISAPDHATRVGYVLKGVRSVVVLANESVCLTRAEAERPEGWGEFIRQWFLRYEPSAWDTVVRTD